MIRCKDCENNVKDKCDGRRIDQYSRGYSKKPKPDWCKLCERPMSMKEARKQLSMAIDNFGMKPRKGCY